MRSCKLTAVAVLGIFISACAPTMRIKPGDIPPPAEVSSPQKVEAEAFVKQYVEATSAKEMPRGAEYARVKRIIDRLARSAGYPPNIFPIHIVDAGQDVNAMVVSGASVVVYKELLSRVPNDNELAVVLGHEMGHALAGHHNELEEQKSRQEAVSTGSSILGTVASVAMSAAGYGGAADLVGSATETSAGLIGYATLVGRFDRRQEYEADHVGLLLMAKAGYDPQAAVTFWNRSNEIFDSQSSQLGAFFSTHPASSDRLKAIEEAMPFAMQYYSPAKK